MRDYQLEDYDDATIAKMNRITKGIMIAVVAVCVVAIVITKIIY